METSCFAPPPRGGFAVFDPYTHDRHGAVPRRRPQRGVVVTVLRYMSRALAGATAVHIAIVAAMRGLLEAVPNFSEGRDGAVLDALTEALAGAGARVLDVHADADHNRSVFTVAADPDSLVEGLAAAIAVAAARIDLTRHEGVHPRVGAADVVPIVRFQPETHGRRRRRAHWRGRIAMLGVPAIGYGDWAADAAGRVPGRRAGAAGGADGGRRDRAAGRPGPAACHRRRGAAGRAAAAGRVQRRSRDGRRGGGAGDRRGGARARRRAGRRAGAGAGDAKRRRRSRPT